MTTPLQPHRDGAEIPGDTGAPDIVGPTGEEMPVATHDEIAGGQRRPDEAPTGGNPVPTKSSRLPR